MNFSLGCIAHLAADQGNGASAVICLLLLFITYVQSKKEEVKTEIKEKPEKIKYA
jgi:hypothetical protein